MAQTSAPTEPKTLEAAFSDHAQRPLGACHSSRRLRPVGNGMPMTKPSGAINATVNSILRDHGGATGGGTQSRPVPEVGCRGLQQSDRTQVAVACAFGGNCLTNRRLIKPAWKRDAPAVIAVITVIIIATPTL